MWVSGMMCPPSSKVLGIPPSVCTGGWLFVFGWLGWLFGWVGWLDVGQLSLASWLVGWLVGWLRAWLVVG